jgi:hypothetical protein
VSFVVQHCDSSIPATLPLSGAALRRRIRGIRCSLDRHLNTVQYLYIYLSIPFKHDFSAALSPEALDRMHKKMPIPRRMERALFALLAALLKEAPGRTARPCGREKPDQSGPSGSLDSAGT